MEKISIGLIIRQIIKENKLSAIDIADKLGVSRQAVYQAFSREKMNLEERKNWAKALGVEVAEFDKRSVNQTTSNGDEYLMKYIQELETRLVKQNETISHLRRVNEVLLGKSASVLIARFAILFFIAFGCKFGYTTIS